MKSKKSEIKNTVFTDGELNHLSATISKRVANLNDEVWKKAFMYYNVYNGHTLSMRCAPCYEKVYQFVWSNHIEKSKS